MKLFIGVFILFSISLTAFSQSKPVRTGRHYFTIQWISFENKPGTALIEALGNGEYSIEGEQWDKVHHDYVIIKGTFKAVDRQLYFDGKIVSRISINNNGQPCELTGKQIFKASGKRKYWRLQHMLNCDNETTDYIDIFF